MHLHGEVESKAGEVCNSEPNARQIKKDGQDQSGADARFQFTTGFATKDFTFLYEQFERI
jgi:hypothetical protein